MTERINYRLSEAAILRRSRWWERAVDHTVRAALQERKAGWAVDPLADAVAKKLAFRDLSFIKGRITALVTAGDILLSDSHLHLSETARQQITSAVESRQKVNRLVEQRYESIRASLRNGDSCPTWPSFEKNVLSPLITELGAHTIELLNGEPGSAARSVMQRYLEGGVEDKAALRQIGVEFFDPEIKEVRAYVFSELQAYYLASARALDKETLKQLTKYRRPIFDLVLDTNAVFSILNLHHNPANEATRYLLELRKEVSEFATVRFYVLNATLEEARSALNSARERCSQAIRTPEQAKALGGEPHASGLVDRYREIASESPVTAESYFAETARYLDIHCAGIGVEVIDQGVINQNATFQARVSDWLSWQEHRRHPRSRGAVTHDITCMTFVESKRQNKARLVAEADWWLLTVDQRLRSFEKANIAGNRTLPVSMAPDELTQVLQFWAPMPEDLEKAMIVGMRLPFSFYDYDNDTQRTSLDILSTLNDFNGADSLTAESTRRILVDKAVRDCFASDESSIDRRRELIESTVVRELKRVEEENKALEGRVKEAESRANEVPRMDSEARAKEAGRVESKNNLLKRVVVAEKEKAKLAQRIQREREKHEAERAELEKRLLDLEERQKQQAQRASDRPRLLAAVVSVFTVPGTLFYLFRILLWDNPGRLWRLAIIITFGWAVATALLPIVSAHFGVQTDWRVISWCREHRRGIWIALVLAALGTAMQFAAVPPTDGSDIGLSISLAP